MVKKILKMFIRFDIIHKRDRWTDRRTDGQTPHDGIGRSYMHSIGAKIITNTSNSIPFQ